MKVTKDLSPEGDVRRLKKGDVVKVTEVEVVKDAVRGRIEGGWITLVDTFYNHRFAKLNGFANSTLVIFRSYPESPF